MIDEAFHAALNRIIITYALTGALVVIVILTLVALARNLRKPKYFGALFTALVLEIVAAALTSYKGSLARGSAQAEATSVAQATAEAAVKQAAPAEPSGQSWVIFIGNYPDQATAVAKRVEAQRACSIQDAEAFQQGKAWFIRVYFPDEATANSGVECLKKSGISRTPSRPRPSTHRFNATGAVHVDIGLPHCAIVHAERAEIPAVVIQSECADDKHYIGYCPISGGNGLCVLSEVELRWEPDATFHQQT